MQMWADYIKEKENKDCFQCETGFVTYLIYDVEGHNELYISDMYVKPEFRNTGAGRSLIKEIERIAKEQNCKKMTAAIWLSNKNPEGPLVADIKYGFRISHVANNNIIYLVKDL